MEKQVKGPSAGKGLACLKISRMPVWLGPGK